MKKKIVFISLFCVALCFSQNKRIVLNWDGVKSYNTDSYKVVVPYFSNKNSFVYSLEEGVVFVEEWDSGTYVNPNSLIITSLSYDNISSSELKDVDVSNIKSSINAKLLNAQNRNDVKTVFKFNPIIKSEDGLYKKVVSISISYSTSSSFKSTNNIQQSVTNSLLNTNKWYRFFVEETGVFKLTKSFLNEIGINTNGIDPRNIKIYGSGGAMIPYINDPSFPIDPAENSIKVVGETDGVFNNEDYILFYAIGPKGFNPDSNSHINSYNDKTYYYINVSNGLGKRIQPYIQPVSPAIETIDSFKDYKFHELDEYSLAFVGRRWFGDKFDEETIKEFDFSFPNISFTEPVNPSEDPIRKPVRLKVIGASTSSSSSNLIVQANGNTESILNLAAVPLFNPTSVAESIYDANIQVNSDDINIRIEHDKLGNPSTEAYLDYIVLEAERDLIYIDEQLFFKPFSENNVTGVVNISLSNAENINEIWEVSDIYNISAVTSPGTEIVVFKSTLEASQEFVALSSTTYKTPLSDSNSLVQNQDLKGSIFLDSNLNFQDIDYLMLTPQSHLAQANRLAEINREVNNLSVKVVTIESIYNEFNTGNPDIAAIRNFVKYVYDNASSLDKKLKYLCLFGDTSFDYKERISSNLYNFPTWNAVSSFNLTSSFISDDFYGLMDSGEGDFEISDRLDIAVGRIIADSPQRAAQMVDKVEAYYKEAALGNWRNNIVMVSDDVDADWEEELQRTTDEIADAISLSNPALNVIKIHTDAYQQESSSGGNRYPSVNTAIANELEKGALMINYFGHGGEDGLAAERIFDKNNVNDLRNVCKYHCFVTVTCEYTKFDNPLRVTAGELVFWNSQGGAIQLVSTTRQIFMPVGVAVNRTLEEYMFDTDVFGNHISVAEAVRLTKNDPSVSTTQQKLLMFSIGDPALRLSFPKPNVVLTTVNDIPIAQQTEPLQSLGYAKLQGYLTDSQNNILTNYNGTLTTTLFDKNVLTSTLANDGTIFNGQVHTLDFEKLGPTIYRGQATITNGQFSFDFIVPRDISIPVGTGKVSFYAQQSGSLEDKSGASTGELLIGGININAPEDSTGPVVNLFMNDKAFVSGGITSSEPLLVANFEDENGINTASGIGHDITVILDGDEVNPIVLNDYYLTELDDYTKGSLEFKFRDLEPGLHTLTLKAWDVYNNSATSEIQFNVIDENKSLVINNVLNYPNPFVNYTEFWFSHNSTEALDILVQIFTISGKLVRTLQGQSNASGCCGSNSSSTSRDVIWDGRDDFGEKIGKGTYIYKLKVRSNTLNKTVEKIEKLVIL
ncbi:type IX secretion system sortase PorU [Aurantibacter sp.]|uniref:type IX secretion system sortase PorU n=1 Tax=Aurantibacter sp. TaxID=2807103 RepID=UPI0035C82A85